MPMPILTRLFALLALALTAAPSSAYWEYGHGAVARIAMEQVRPDTRAKVAALLRQGALLDTPTCSIATPELAAYWADCIKGLGDRFSYAFSWHYQNVDICRPFDLKAACKDGHCVSAQIERQARLLADTSLPARERVQALAFLMHFVGDLHQPMHAGDHGDLGGNRVAANYGVIGGRTNLHLIWDGWLAERAATTPPAGPSAILAEVPAAERASIAAGSVEDWSRDMWKMAQESAYASLLNDPCGPSPAERPTLTEADVASLTPVVRRNLAQGGIRLARLLDDALGPEHKAPGQKR